jgi:hypothetical protein
MNEQCDHDYEEEKIIDNAAGTYVVYKCTKCGDRYSERIGVNRGDNYE